MGVISDNKSMMSAKVEILVKRKGNKTFLPIGKWLMVIANAVW